MLTGRPLFLPTLALCISAVGATEAAAQGSSGFELSGSIGFEQRTFFNDASFPQAFDHFQPSLILEPNLRWTSEDKDHQLVLTPFLRLDSQDKERTHFDLREAYYRFIGDDFEVVAGLAKVFWGVTESRHLVDVINTVDGVEDIDNEDKLGQPLAKLSLFKDWGQFDAFFLWGFRPQTFPGADGRLRPPLAVNEDEAVYNFDLERGRPGAALRYSNTFGNFDVGLSYFHGPGREPDFTLSPTRNSIAPVYSIINQAGLDVQYTVDAWLFKFEGIAREGQGNTFLATVAGFEHTFYQVVGDNWDLGVLFEYLYDGREAFSFTDPSIDFSTFVSPAPPTAFENDIFIGTRLAFNDPQDTSLLAAAIFDAEDGSTALTIEGERRLGDNWKLELESRLFLNVADDNQLAIFREDDFMTLRLTRFF